MGWSQKVVSSLKNGQEKNNFLLNYLFKFIYFLYYFLRVLYLHFGRVRVGGIEETRIFLPSITRSSKYLIPFERS